MKWLSKLFGKSTADDKRLVSDTGMAVRAPATKPQANVPIYPPLDPGLEVCSPEQILQSQHEMVLRLRRLAGGQDTQFDQLYKQVLIALAAYIQLLPASKSDTHAGAGGLFRLCLEIGFHSLQHAQGKVFAMGEGVERRRIVEPRWHYVTFLAGLFVELHRLISDMVVTDEHGNVWPKYTTSIANWADANKVGRYYVSWSSDVTGAKGGRPDVSAIISSVLPRSSLQYIEEGSPRLLPEFYKVASGSAHISDNYAAEIVASVQKKIYKKDEVRRPENYGKLTVGSHIEPHLVDAMRELVVKGTWKINTDKARLWFAQDGLFAVWKSAAKDIQILLKERGIQGVPTEYETLAEMLAKAGLIKNHSGQPFVQIKPPGSEVEWLAVQIANPLALLEEGDVEQLEERILVGEGAKTVKAAVEKKSVAASKTAEKSTAPTPAKADAPVVADANTPSPDKKADKPAAAKTKPKKQEGIDRDRDLVALAESDKPQLNVTDESDEIEPPVDGRVGNTDTTTIQDSPKSSVESSVMNKPAVTVSTEEVTVQKAAPIVAETTQMSFEDFVPENIRPMLKNGIGEVLGRMISEYKKLEADTEHITEFDQGVAFSVASVQSYGFPIESIVKQFSENGWLMAPADKPMAKVVRVKMGHGRMVLCVVIKIDVAASLGLTREEVSQ